MRRLATMTAMAVILAFIPAAAQNPTRGEAVQSTGGSLVTVGSFHGGIKQNIVPDRVDLQLTVRADDPETRTALLDGIDRLARGTVLVLGMPEDRLPTDVRSTT